MAVSSSNASFRYSAFLSYSHYDQHWAKWLQSALETYRIPSRLVGLQTESGPIPHRLAPVCRDRSDMRSSADLGANIRQSLLVSANLIVICSPSASVSRWVNEEIGLFMRMGRADRVFCLVVDGEPNANGIQGREKEECLPPALRFVYDAAGKPVERRHEPTAADVRRGRDGRNNAKLKLIAGLLNVDLDVLKRRDERRRLQRMATITTLAVVIMLITTALAIEALIKRNEAFAERLTAERRQKQAEDLVDFMLGDLNDKLRQVQRLDILEAVDNHAVEYFESLPTQDVNDQTLSERVKALQEIGRVRADQGNLVAALKSYRASSALASELLRRNPADPERLATFAETLNFTGNAYWYQGDLVSALASFRQAIKLLGLSTTGPVTEARQAELASAQTNAARVLEIQGDFNEAKALYETVLVTYQMMASQDAAPRWKSRIADAYDSLGKVAMEQGELSKAIIAYQDVGRIRIQLVSLAPHDHAVQEDLLVSEAILGRTLALCGADQEAENSVRRAVEAANTLVHYDESQTDWLDEMAEYSLVLGGLERSVGRLDEAVRLDSEALRVLSVLVSKDNTNAAWRREMANAQIEFARLQLALKNLAKADQLVAFAISTITREQSVSPSDRTLNLIASQAHFVQGQIDLLHRDKVSAQAAFSLARDAVAPAAEVGADPNFLSAWAVALVELGDQRARPIINRLALMGFKSRDFQQIMRSVRQPYTPKNLEMECKINRSPLTANERF